MLNTLYESKYHETTKYGYQTLTCKYRYIDSYRVSNQYLLQNTNFFTDFKNLLDIYEWLPKDNLKVTYRAMIDIYDINFTVQSNNNNNNNTTLFQTAMGP